MTPVRHYPIDPTPAQLARDVIEAAKRQERRVDFVEWLNCVICAAAGAMAVLLAQYIWAAV